MVVLPLVRTASTSPSTTTFSPLPPASLGHHLVELPVKLAWTVHTLLVSVTVSGLFPPTVFSPPSPVSDSCIPPLWTLAPRALERPQAGRCGRSSLSPPGFFRGREPDGSWREGFQQVRRVRHRDGPQEVFFGKVRLRKRERGREREREGGGERERGNKREKGRKGERN